MKTLRQTRSWLNRPIPAICCHHYKTESTLCTNGVQIFPAHDVATILGLLPIFLHSSEIKSGSGLGTRLTLTVILIPTKLLWQCKSGLKGWKSPPAPNCLTKDFFGNLVTVAPWLEPTYGRNSQTLSTFKESKTNATQMHITGISRLSTFIQHESKFYSPASVFWSYNCSKNLFPIHAYYTLLLTHYCCKLMLLNTQEQ